MKSMKQWNQDIQYPRILLTLLAVKNLESNWSKKSKTQFCQRWFFAQVREVAIICSFCSDKYFPMLPTLRHFSRENYNFRILSWRPILVSQKMMCVIFTSWNVGKESFFVVINFPYLSLGLLRYCSLHPLLKKRTSTNFFKAIHDGHFVFNGEEFLCPWQC